MATSLLIRKCWGKGRLVKKIQKLGKNPEKEFILSLDWIMVIVPSLSWVCSYHVCINNLVIRQVDCWEEDPYGHRAGQVVTQRLQSQIQLRFIFLSVTGQSADLGGHPRNIPSLNKAQKVSGLWSSVGFKIGAVMRFFLFLATYFLLANREMYTQGPNCPYTKYGG